VPSEPGIPPEQKRHQDDQPSGEKKKKPLPRGHAATRRLSLGRDCVGNAVIDHSGNAEEKQILRSAKHDQFG
jgi:hypothetical protein